MKWKQKLLNHEGEWKFTVTASSISPLSCKYFKTHVKTLAVASWAAKITPITLSAIWESFSWSTFWFLAPNRFPSNPPPFFSFSLLSCINILRVSFSSFLAFSKQTRWTRYWEWRVQPERLWEKQNWKYLHCFMERSSWKI